MRQRKAGLLWLRIHEHMYSERTKIGLLGNKLRLQDLRVRGFARVSKSKGSWWHISGVKVQGRNEYHVISSILCQARRWPVPEQWIQ